MAEKTKHLTFNVITYLLRLLHKCIHNPCIRICQTPDEKLNARETQNPGWKWMRSALLKCDSDFWRYRAIKLQSGFGINSEIGKRKPDRWAPHMYRIVTVRSTVENWNNFPSEIVSQPNRPWKCYENRLFYF